tara:strand:- start:97 stop:498 length:402 start_codon:yes stop_codon:yes gene_type:complete
MLLSRLIYCSQPFGYDQPMLNGILADARTYNPKNNITGALICREDIFLQLLEGPEDKLLLTYDKILNDDRHLDIELLVKELCDDRLFPSWSMKDDPAKTWFWTKDEIDSGILTTVSKSDLLGVFDKVALNLKD